MALTAFSIAAGIHFTLAKSNTPFPTAKLQGQLAYSLAPGVGTFNKVLAARYTVAASGTQTIDLFATFTDLVGSSNSATKVCGLLLVPTGTGAACKLEPGASNPLTWFFAGTTPSITVPTGGVFLFAQPLAQTVDATHRNLLVTNTGSAALTLDVAFILG